MKVLIMDGTFGDDYNANSDKIIEQLKESGHFVKYMKASEMNMAFCTGCWSCWYKTPGKCAHNDDTQEMLRNAINADLIIHITETSLGYISSWSKKYLDKFVPLVHPYITIIDGECRHKARYKKYPDWGIIHIDPDKREEKYELVKEHFRRASLNAKSEILFTDMITGKESGLDETNFAKWLTKG